MSDNQLSLTIKLSNDTRYTITIDETSTVKQLKEKIDDEQAISADRQILIYSGKVLKDEEILKEAKITTGQTIHLVKSSKSSGSSSTSKPAEKSTPAADSNTSSTTNTSSTPAQTQPQAQPNLFGAFGPNPFGQNTNSNNSNPLGGGFNSNPFGDMGSNPFGGMGGAPNMQGMQQMMNNPEVMSMMTSMLSNPEMARLVINSNPQLQNMGVTPEMLSGMVSNPLFQSLMSNPELARNMAQFGGMGNPFGGAPGANPSDNQNAGNAENRSNNLAQLLSQMPQLGSAPVQPVSNPEERYQNELAQLREMGFTDPAKNVRALLASGGDVNLAIEYLFNQP